MIRHAAGDDVRTACASNVGAALRATCPEYAQNADSEGTVSDALSYSLLLVAAITVMILMATSRYFLPVFVSPIFHELLSFGTPAARRKSLWRARRELYKLGRYRFTMAVTALVWSLIVLPVFAFAPTPSFMVVGVSVALVLCPIASTWTNILLFRDELRTSLRKQLREAGVPICIACGYDLTGSVSEVCSECGTRIR